MARSVWKGPFVHPSLLKKIDKLKNEPNKTPKLQKAWKPDIIDFFSRDSILVACKFIHISNNPKQIPKKNANNIKDLTSVIKGTGSQSIHWNKPTKIRIFFDDILAIK